MRTLKKSLALILAVVLVLGVCAMGASAEFKDADKIVNEEAAAVLNAIGVIKGRDTGNFDPEGELTRAEGVAIITRLLGEDDLGGVPTFADSKDHWAASAIAFCAAQGIANGYDADHFGPNDKMSGYAFAKWLLVALGYNAEYRGMVGADWAVNTAKLVKAEKLLEGIEKFDGNANCTRQNAAQMALNLLACKTVTTNVTGGGTTVKGEGFEVTTEKSYTESKSTTDTFNSTYFNKLVKTATPGVDKDGRPVATEWKLDTKVVYTKNAEPVASFNGNLTKNELDKLDKAAKGNYDFTGATVYYNGATGVLAVADLYVNATTGVNGYAVEIYADADKKVTSVVVTEGYFAQVGKTTEAKGSTPAKLALTVYEVGKGTPVAMTITDDTKKTDDMFDVLSKYAEKDYVEVVLTPGWDVDKTEASVREVKALTAVAGKVTKYSKGTYNCTSTFVVDGTTYKFNNEATYATDATSGTIKASALKVGDEGTAYLDGQGNVLGFVLKAAAEAETAYTFYVEKYQTKSTDSYGKETTKNFAQCVELDGTSKTYEVTATVYAALPAVGSGNLLKKVTLDADGMASFADDAAIKNNTALTLASGAKKIADNEYFDSAVKFIYVDKTLGDLKVTVKDGVQVVTSASVTYLVEGKDTNKTVKVVFVKGAYTEPSVASTEIVFVNGDTASDSTALVTKADGKTATAYEKTVYIDGKKATIYVAAADAIANGFYTYTKDGELYTLTSKTADNLIASTAVGNMYNGMITVGTKVVDMAVAGATLVNTSSNEFVPDDATKLSTKDSVALVLSSDGKTISTIYVTASTRTE